MSSINREELGEWLSAYLDGEVDAEQKVRIERLLNDDPEARRLLDELSRTIKAVSSLPRHLAPASIAEDVQLRLERSELLSESGVASSVEGGRALFVPAMVAVAAVLGLAVGGLWFMAGGKPRGAGLNDGALALRSQEATRMEPGKFPSEGFAPESKAIGRRGRSAEDLLATASFEQKLRAGLGVEAVRNHPFGNEPVRLQIPVRTRAQRDAVTARLVAFLADRRALDLAQATQDISAEFLSKRSFYYQGKPNANFTPADERQFLVRSSREELGSLLDELTNTTKKGEGVVLVAGSLSIRGLTLVRAALQGTDIQLGATAAESIAGDDAEATSGQAAVAESEDADRLTDSGLFDVLLRSIVPFDPAALSPGLEGEDGPESASTSTSSRTASARPVESGEAEEPPVAAATPAARGGAPAGTHRQAGTHKEDRVDARDVGTNTSEDETSSRNIGSTGVKTAKSAEPPSLVRRRLKAIRESRGGGSRRAAVPADVPVSPEAGEAVERTAESYVTLVIRVAVVEPKPPEPLGRTKALPENLSR